MGATNGDILWVATSPDDIAVMITDLELDTIAVFEKGADEPDAALCRFINSFGMYDQIIIAGKNIRHTLTVLEKDFPQTYSRINQSVSIDVPALGELFSRWSPTLHQHRPSTPEPNDLLGELQEQVNHLRYYKELMFPF